MHVGGEQVHAFDAATDPALWSLTLENPMAEPVIAVGARRGVVADGTDMLVFDPATGRVATRLRGPARIYSLRLEQGLQRDQHRGLPEHRLGHPRHRRPAGRHRPQGSRHVVVEPVHDVPASQGRHGRQLQRRLCEEGASRMGRGSLHRRHGQVDYASTGSAEGLKQISGVNGTETVAAAAPSSTRSTSTRSPRCSRTSTCARHCWRASTGHRSPRSSSRAWTTPSPFPARRCSTVSRRATRTTSRR
ncbi:MULTISPECIES: hypothetical protein [Streptomyces]|uniref:hypothetical protein n=1 Tax=Streptomyces TaxID=1883 RepID=UPI00279589A7|nr:hypothetical protein [Streptomyces canarius]